MYVIQERSYLGKWETLNLLNHTHKFDSLEAAKKALDSLFGDCATYRIAEEYTVTITKYKAVK